jgi:hypothetical protein
VQRADPVPGELGPDERRVVVLSVRTNQLARSTPVDGCGDDVDHVGVDDHDDHLHHQHHEYDEHDQHDDTAPRTDHDGVPAGGAHR